MAFARSFSCFQNAIVVGVDELQSTVVEDINDIIDIHAGFHINSDQLMAGNEVR